MSGGTSRRDVTEVRLAAWRDGRILLVREAGTDAFVLPGGEPAAGEDERAALRREVLGRLGCGLAGDPPAYLGTFSGWADGMDGVRVHVHLYGGSLDGEPEPRPEAGELAWVDPAEPGKLPMARGLAVQVLPFLARGGR